MSSSFQLVQVPIMMLLLLATHLSSSSRLGSSVMAVTVYEIVSRSSTCSDDAAPVRVGMTKYRDIATCAMFFASGGVGPGFGTIVNENSCVCSSCNLPQQSVAPYATYSKFKCIELTDHFTYDEHVGAVSKYIPGQFLADITYESGSCSPAGIDSITTRLIGTCLNDLSLAASNTLMYILSSDQTSYTTYFYDANFCQVVSTSYPSTTTQLSARNQECRLTSRTQKQTDVLVKGTKPAKQNAAAATVSMSTMMNVFAASMFGFVLVMTRR